MREIFVFYSSLLDRLIKLQELRAALLRSMPRVFKRAVGYTTVDSSAYKALMDAAMAPAASAMVRAIDKLAEVYTADYPADAITSLREVLKALRSRNCYYEIKGLIASSIKHWPRDEEVATVYYDVKLVADWVQVIDDALKWICVYRTQLYRGLKGKVRQLVRDIVNTRLNRRLFATVWRSC